MRFRTLIAAVPLGLAILLPGTAVADPAPPTFPILPNQFFNGVVNGKISNATIYTVCPARPQAAPGTRPVARPSR